MFQHHRWLAWTVVLLIWMALDGLDIPVQAAPRSEQPIHCGPVQSDETWSAANVHVVACPVRIPTGVTLTIEAGAVVKLQEHAQIAVDGRLHAQGTEDAPIYFTSYQDDAVGGDTDGIAATPAAGDWANIQFSADSDDDSIISRAVIRYSGRDKGTLSVDTLNDGAIRLDNASPTLSYITFEQNARNGVELHSGLSSGGEWYSDTLDNTTVIYALDKSNLIVPLSHTLTISPGVKLKLGQQERIQINGELDAAGAINAPIVFTSLNDDSVCGVGAFNEPICDTNGDGMGDDNATPPAMGDWGNIRFAPDSADASTISRAAIHYSGRSTTGDITEGAIWLDDAAPRLAYITFTHNYINGAVLRGGTEWHSAVWNSPTVVHVLEKLDLTVAAGHALRIAPGMRIKLGRHANINVNGKLTAAGVPDAPIYFTSIHDDGVCGVGAAGEAVCATLGGSETEPHLGDWGHIRFQPGSDDDSLIARANIRYSGSNFGDRSDDGAIYLDNASPVLSHISFMHNYINGVELAGPRDWTSDVWDNTTVIYALEEGDITVPVSHTLTITPGMRIKLGNGSGLDVAGRLVMAGDAAAPIYLSSLYDRILCGAGAQGETVCRTHRDSADMQPQPGDWGQIRFSGESTDGSRISHAIIRYGGSGDGTEHNAALLLDGVAPPVAHSTLARNVLGVKVRNANPAFTCNDFYGNVDYGMYNATPLQAITAAEHWWGALSGPTHASNPDGTGDRVSDGVQFQPWRTHGCLTQANSSAQASDAEIDVAVRFGPMPDSLASGDVLTHTIVISNRKAVTATGVTFSLVAPGSWLNAASPALRNCSQGQDRIHCLIGDLATQSSLAATITMRVTAAGLAPGSHELNSTVSLSARETDIAPANNADTHTAMLHVDEATIFLPLVVQ